MPDLNSVAQLLIQYRYLVLFPAVVVEGPIVTLIAGFLITLHYFSFLPLLLVIVVADISSDAFYYAFGRWGRNYALLRILKIPDEKVRTFEGYVGSRLFRTIALSKVLHGVGAAVLIAAGSARAPFITFIVYSLIITTVKSLVLLVLGFFFGQWIVQLNSFLDYFAFFTFVLVFGVLLFLLLHKKKSTAV